MISETRIVVKIGSSVIAPEGKINQKVIRNFARDCAKLDKEGIKTILVSSGAIACGLNQLGYKKRPQDVYSLMALASLGQVILMNVYGQAFRSYGKTCGQVLLTWDDFNLRQRYLNARHTIERLLGLGVIPIINENDAVSYQEIKFGDNDRLSALVSDLVGAKLLIILSDVEGLTQEKKVIEVVEKIDAHIMSLAKKEDSAFTTGGMVTKLEAAKIATRAGIKVVIANGNLRGVISKVVKGQNLGTTFLPRKEVEKAKKRWIAFSKKIKGRIYIDEGAKEAILYRGKSLLSCGVLKVEGDFSRSDAVEVLDSQGKIIGCGLVEYNSFELTEVKRKRYEREIIHRDNFVKREA
jgi:glutamate 5-kinase